jgi:hypothetical protein
LFIAPALFKFSVAVAELFFLFTDSPPGAAVPSHKFVGFLRSPRAGSIVGKTASRERFPNVNDRLDGSPTGFHHVRALKKSGVAHHAVVKKAFVACAVRLAKIARVIEIHVHQAELHDRAGNLGGKTPRNAFVGLDVDHEPVGARVLDGSLSKQHERRPAKLDGDFRHALGETLSSAEVKRHIGPAPIIDFEF